jgi:hypothetical protein
MHVATLGTETASHGVSDARRSPRWQVAAWSLIAYLLLVLVAWSAPSPDVANPPPKPEEAIKAAFLYKFLSFAEWPAGALGAPSSPIVIGVLGADDIADDLRAIVATRRVGQHPLEVRRVGERVALDGVNVLFIGAGAAAALPRLAPAAQQRSVLLVTDFANALSRGSVINLVVVDDRVRFEVSLEAAERSGLKLSSRMLALAMWVRPAH